MQTLTATTPKTKTTYPVINTVLIEFSLMLRPDELHDFREAVLNCIPLPEEREIFSNENWESGSKKTIVRYPMVQFRQRNGHAAIWAMQTAIPVLYKFIHQYKQNFTWRNKKFQLHIAQLPIEENNFRIDIIKPNPLMPLRVYHLFYYIPFINDNKNNNYDWYKQNRNLPDIEKTKKLEALLTAHICSFIHYAGGFISKQKIKLAILDKKLLKGVHFKSREYPAYEIRYTVNINLPSFIAIGNKCSHGFGWQIQEAEQPVL